MLEIKNANISVGGRLVVSDFSLMAADSEVCCIVGNRGTGKSTLLNAIMGLHPLDSGHVSIDGELLLPTSALEFRRHLISFVPQRPSFDAYTVEEIATTVFSLQSNAGKALPKSLLTEEWQRLNLAADTYSRHFSELSTGERVKALLAIVCMQNKPIVLVDEPTEGMDTADYNLTASYLRSRAERGQTVLVTTTSMDFAEMTTTPNNIKTL